MGSFFRFSKPLLLYLFNMGNAGPFPTLNTRCVRSEGEAIAHCAPPPTGGGIKVMAPTGSGEEWKADQHAIALGLMCTAVPLHSGKDRTHSTPLSGDSSINTNKRIQST